MQAPKPDNLVLNMKILITGSAGNLGSFLAKHLLENSQHHLRLLVHEKGLSPGLANNPHVQVFKADLERPETLTKPCQGSDCVIHLAGVLFRPWPGRFLPRTNVGYVRNLLSAAIESGVKRFILVSFPHVEGETTPGSPATGRLDGNPPSVHARTRLAAERLLISSCEGTDTTPVALRPGFIYGRGILMVEAGRWLARHGLLVVWRKPTWYHLLSLPDFLSCVLSAIEKDGVSGVYGLGDDAPITLQDFADTVSRHWGYWKPWRLPAWMFYLAGLSIELFATVFRTPSPLTRDFVRIGMASFCSDTSRMKKELLPELRYPAIREGLELL